MASRTQQRGNSREEAERRLSEAELSQLTAFLDNELASRLANAPDRLLNQMAGSVLLQLSGLGSYLVNGMSREIRALEDVASVELENSEGYDCKVQLSARDFLMISNGKVNPQIAMLSEKVKISGKVSLAVYLFNLIAPYDQN